MTESPKGSDVAATLPHRLGLVAGTATVGAGVMAVLWAVAGRNVGPAAEGPAVFTASVSLWWGLFAVLGIAAALGALLVGRRGTGPAEKRLHWGALILCAVLLVVGRIVGAVPF